jgi:hypothetical protein
MEFPDDKYLSEIGRICVAFSELESNYNILLQLLIDPTSQTGTIIAAQLSFQKLLEVTGALAVHRIPSSGDTATLEEIVKRSASLEGERNTIIHSYYFIDEASPTKNTIRNKATAKRFKGLRHQREIVKVEDLRSLSDRIAAVSTEVNDFTVMLMYKKPFRAKLRL